MDREEVKQILIFFGEIDGLIDLNTRLINDTEEKYYSLNNGGSLDGMPKAKYRTPSPTESVALNIPESVSEAIRGWREENERLCRLKAAIEGEIRRLPHAQRTVIYDFYVNRYRWTKISRQTNYSERQCRNIRDQALSTLAGRFERLPPIAGLFLYNSNVEQ